MLLGQITQLENVITSYNSALATITNNISNLETPGFKRSEARFQDVLRSVIRAGTETTNPIESGGTMAISETKTDFLQGDAISGGALDLMINGAGFFIVSPDGVRKQLGRGGSFHLSSDYRLVDAQNRQAYGFEYGSSVLVPITFPEGTVESSLRFSTGGVLYNGTTPSYIMALTNVPNQQGLAPAGGSAFEETVASGVAYTPTISGGASYVGFITPNQIEASNAELAKESTEAEILNRNMQAAIAMVSLYNKMLENAARSLIG